MNAVEFDVVVIGEALVDIVERADGIHEFPGGSPLNVAVGLGRLGRATTVLTRLGADEHGLLVRQHLEESGVSLGTVQDASRTATARARLDATGAASYEFDIAWSLELEPLPTSRLVHTGSIGAWMLPGCEQVLRLVSGRPQGVIATFDPNIRPGLVAEHASVLARVEALASVVDLVKLSDQDADWLYPGLTHYAVLERLLSCGATVAIMTRGATGAVARSARARAELASRTVTVVDTIGAGDAFMSGLIDAWLTLSDASLDPANAAGLRALLARGTSLGALTVSRAGANPPWNAELEHAGDPIHDSRPSR